jgi:DNA uptake protein ComE-like DNA-binding protein
VRKLTAASPDEIAEVPGIGPRLAETIVAALHRDTSSDTTTSDTAKPEEAR